MGILIEEGAYVIQSFQTQSVIGMETFKISEAANEIVFESYGQIEPNNFKQFLIIKFDFNWLPFFARLHNEKANLIIEYSINEAYTELHINNHNKKSNLRIPAFRVDVFLYYKGAISAPFLWTRNNNCRVGKKKHYQGIPEGMLEIVSRDQQNGKQRIESKMVLNFLEDKISIEIDEDGRLLQCKAQNQNIQIKLL